MQSKSATADEYLRPSPLTDAPEAVRKVIRANLDKPFEEGMQYGMIGYYLPHSVYPDGYHCDPKRPHHQASYREEVRRELPDGAQRDAGQINSAVTCVPRQIAKFAGHIVNSSSNDVTSPPTTGAAMRFIRCRPG